jgi:predicted nuclease of predicted toxin-antitoxin system
LKLLVDANLSPRLIRRIEDLFPGSVHVFDTGLARFTPDIHIWEFAKAAGLAILTADSDFLALSHEKGSPPQVIRIERCSIRTAAVEGVLRHNAVRIGEFERSGRPLLILRP